MNENDRNESARVRLDKWLWAARFFKNRGLATEAVEGGRVHLNGTRVKPAHGVKVGDRLELTLGHDRRSLTVRGLSERRGPASEAQQLYEESAESIAAREAAAEQRKLGTEPAAERQGRPTKRARRDYDRWSN
ncbi:RNA-binding S4 domain-containing protein [Niveibacterium sp. SC-1]|uniref:RNA-binding S4 domain-containing protein n=1 Tax=Niveibacterium sp. SC-1 TaxID=3135646 RepID=UPI00311F0136